MRVVTVILDAIFGIGIRYPIFSDEIETDECLIKYIMYDGIFVGSYVVEPLLHGSVNNKYY